MKKSGKRPSRFKSDIEHKKKAIDKRESLSYEDVPIDDYFDESVDKVEMPTPVIKLLIILLSCTAVILIWTNWSNLSPDKVALWIQDSVLGIGSGQGFPVAISGNEVRNANFKLLDSDVAIVSDTSFFTVNKQGKQTCNRQHSFSSPVLMVDGNISMLYNRGGKGLQIESISNEIRKASCDNAIQAADISSSGVYAVVTESKSYLSEMTVYLKDNTEKYKYYFSECYVMNIDVNSDGSMACASGVLSRDGAMTSIIYVFDFNKTDPLLKLEFEGLPVNIEFINNNKLSFITDKALNIIDINSKSNKEINYDKRILTSYAIDKGEKICLALSSSTDGRNCDILMVDKSGNITVEFKTEIKILSLALKDNIIEILSPSTLNIYSNKGELINKKEAGNDAKEIILCSKHDAYILGVSDIRKMNF